MRRFLTLAVPVLLTLSACSSTRPSSRYPGGRTVPTPAGDVIVMPDGRVYRDADRDGIPDRDERVDQNGRTTVCHKGRTLTVGSSAVQAHLRHGDYVGACGNGTYNRNGTYDRRDDRRDRDDHDRNEHRRGQGKSNRGRGHHDD